MTFSNYDTNCGYSKDQLRGLTTNHSAPVTDPTRTVWVLPSARNKSKDLNLVLKAAGAFGRNHFGHSNVTVATVRDESDAPICDKRNITYPPPQQG